MKRKILVLLPMLLALSIQFTFAAWPTGLTIEDDENFCASEGGCDGSYDSVNQNRGFLIPTVQLRYSDVWATCVGEKEVRSPCIYGYKADGREIIFDQEPSFSLNAAGIFAHILITIGTIGLGVFYARSRH